MDSRPETISDEAALAEQLIDDRPYPGSFDTDACTDWIYLGIMRPHRNFRPHTRFAYDSNDLDRFFIDLGDFLLEQFLDQVGRCP